MVWRDAGIGIAGAEQVRAQGAVDSLGRQGNRLEPAFLEQRKSDLRLCADLGRKRQQQRQAALADVMGMHFFDDIADLNSGPDTQDFAAIFTSVHGILLGFLVDFIVEHEYDGRDWYICPIVFFDRSHGIANIPQADVAIGELWKG